jgi:hypothetical protein
MSSLHIRLASEMRYGSGLTDVGGGGGDVGRRLGAGVDVWGVGGGGEDAGECLRSAARKACAKGPRRAAGAGDEEAGGNCSGSGSGMCFCSAGANITYMSPSLIRGIGRACPRRWDGISIPGNGDG